jgi:hypothetical protein
MVPRFVFETFFIAFAVVVTFAIVTTVKHVACSRLGASTTRVG